MPVSVATDWIRPSLLTLSVQLQITSCLSVCEASRMTLQGGDSRSLSVHSFSVRGQLVLPGPSLSQWCCGRCACVSALSRVIAMCQRAWPSLTRGICRLVCVAWVTIFLGRPILSSPLLSSTFLWVLRCWLLFRTQLQLCHCSLRRGIQVALLRGSMIIIRLLAFDMQVFVHITTKHVFPPEAPFWFDYDPVYKWSVNNEVTR